MPIIGHACKMAHGWALGESADSVLAMEAWNMAKKTFERLGVGAFISWGSPPTQIIRRISR